jgi:tripartite ATP-independent transporter DctP family solute receptor
MITRRSVLKAGAVAGATVAMPWVARATPIQVRLGHAANEIHPGHIAALEFRKAINRLAPGALEIVIFPNRQLGDDKQNLESCVVGTLQMCGASGILYPLVTGKPSLDAYQLPFLIRDYDQFAKLALSDTTQKIYGELEEAGIVPLQTTDIGQRHFVSAARPVTRLEDFAGLKTRIVPVPLHKAIWEAIGVAPIGLPYGEVYGALETKVIDACEINVSSMLAENLWEVGKNFTLTGHYPWHNTLSMNKLFYDGLPADLQKAVRQAGRESVQPTLDYTAEQDYSGRNELRAKGVEILELEGLDAMKTKTTPLFEMWERKSPLIAEFVELAKST